MSQPEPERYGNVRVAKIRAAYNDLRKAIRSGDVEAADAALDRYEPWADYIFSKGALPKPPEDEQ